MLEEKFMKTIVAANGRANISPYMGTCSGNRAILGKSAFDQCISVIDNEPPRVETLFTNGLVHSTFNITAENNYVLFKVIQKTINGQKADKKVYILVDHENKVLHLLDHTKYVETNEDYGFISNTDLEGMAEGSEVPKGSHLERSNNFKEEGYSWGVNLRTMYSISSTTIEDSVLLSTKAAERLKYLKVMGITVILDLNNNILKNIYGNEESYQPIPNVGEKVRKDSVIMCVNENPTKYQILKDPKTSMEIAITDTCYFMSYDAVISDIEVLTEGGEAVIHDLYLKNIYKQNIQYFTDVYNAMVDTMNYFPNYKLSFEFESKFDYLQSILIQKAGFRKDNNTIPVTSTIIKMSLYKVCDIKPGQKITGRHGNKGVCSDILDGVLSIGGIYESGILKDSDGNDIDVILNTSGVINRSNMGQIYEKSTNNVFDAIIKRYKNDRVNYQEIDEILSYSLLKIAPEHYEIHKELIKTYGVKEVCDSILDNDFIIYNNPFPEEVWHSEYKDNVLKRSYELNHYLKQKRIAIGKEDIYMQRTDGTLFKLHNKMEVSRMYFVLLQHTAEKKYAVRAKGSYDSMGNLSKTQEKKQRRVRFPNTPIKIGERDFVVLTSVLDKETLSNFLKNLDSENIDTFRAFFNCMGIDFYIDDESDIEEDEEEDYYQEVLDDII